jgi:hypothetical protein
VIMSIGTAPLNRILAKFPHGMALSIARRYRQRVTMIDTITSLASQSPA